MRPIRLTLQAFGPFAATEVVDFRPALESGLFGIYGQTGAGKSTLFSAMSFALFGVPTKTDQEPRSLRSDHAAADVPTDIEFVFELGPKTYLIRRRPTQERPKKHGDGTTEDAAEASLFDVTGIPIDTLGPNASGRVIAERKVSVVGQQVETLLGYGADQFRQIVLLPQGKFETFLAAKTDARVAILRDLFDVKVYRDLAARLKEGATEAEHTLRNQRSLYVARLEERGFESAEALEAGITVAQDDVAQTNDIEQGAKDAHETARKALSQAEQIEKAFAAVETAQATLNDIEANGEAIAALAQRVDEVSNALRARDLEAAWHEEEQGRRDAAEAVLVAEAACETAVTEKADAARRLVEVQADAGRRQQVQDDLVRLATIEQQVDQAAALSLAFDEAVQEDTAAKGALAEAIVARERLQAKRDKGDAVLEQGRKAAIARGELNGALAEVRRDHAVATAYAKAQAAVVDAERNLGLASDTFQDKAAEAQKAEDRLADAEARLSRTQAIILAEKLTDKDPCPVCGSSDHPTPARGTIAQTGLTEAFRHAQRQARDAAEARVRAESARDTCISRLEHLKQVLEEQEEPARLLADLEADVVRLKGEVTALEDAIDLEAVSEDLAELKRALISAETVEVDARTAAGITYAALAGAQAKRDAVFDVLPEDLRVPAAVTARRSALQDQERQLSQALERAVVNDREAGDALTRAQEKREAAQSALEMQAKRETKAQGDLQARLDEVGLDVVAYEACKAYFSTLADDQKKIVAHNEGLIAARTTLQNAKAACADHARPDLDPLRSTLTQRSQALEAATQAQAVAKTGVSSLVAFKASLAEALKETERLEEETGPLRGLAEMANGKNDVKMTLETFAIGAMFDHVLEAANMRLEPMTRGRYRLMRGSEASGGRGKRGLEIEVFDINTGKARPTATLSGGETFISALALALGLADVVESLSGKIRMDTIFIDEGFGSLDTENGAGTLEQVLGVLSALTEGRRAVGLISHVGLVQEAIPQGFYVRSTPSGSKVEERRGLG